MQLGDVEVADKVAQLKDLTGLDEDLCRNILEQNSWDVEKSFERLFDTTPADAEADPAVATRTARRPVEPAVRRRRRSPSRQGPDGRSNPAPVAPVRHLGWLEWAWRWIALPWHILLHIFHLLMGRAPAAPPPEPFSEFFEKHFGQDHPIFFPGQFRDALNEARLRFRPLIVYLHSPRQPASQRFCREVLADPAVMDFLDQNFVVWAADATHGAGNVIASNLGADGFPFIAGAIYNYGPGGSVFMMKLNQFVGPAVLLEQLNLLLEQASPVLTAAKIDAEEVERGRLIREQQDQEYEQALRLDREREQREAAERKAIEDAKRAEEEAAAAALAAERKQEEERARKAAEVPPEPEPGAGICTVSVRLPEGRQVRRRFRGEETVGVLRAFAESIPPGFSNHNLLVYPKTLLEDDSQTLLDVGLSPGGIVIVAEKLQLNPQT